MGKLWDNKIEAAIAKDDNLIAVVTFLVMRWIEVFHPQKQYALLLKKAMKFIGREVKDL